ncbi:uncharacterized protein LTR77_000457 [Saxophila tyrrhenica]|uniref:Uncharacterized protein n=1 Tax=Saxophila tyrrhenica TaxID=1690608 RepID=A0AAV9PN26_9PEZI|nr:hypothetical protein LTR77_000457 [Saxophila tyrrhenica]
MTALEATKTPSSVAGELRTPINMTEQTALEREFQQQRASDRAYYFQHVRDFITRDQLKWAAKSTSDRKKAISAKRTNLIKKRNGDVGMRTTGFRFPDLHDDVTERAWLLGHFADYIDWTGPGAKRGKGARQTGGPTSYEDPSTEGEESEEEYEEDGDDEEVMPVKQEVEEKQETVPMPKTPAKTVEKEVPVTTFSVALMLQENPHLATKPYWGFNDMMEIVLIVPQGDATEKADGEGYGTKRKAEEFVGEDAAKRARV